MAIEMEISAYVLIFFGVMSFVAFAMTMYDKLAAQAGKRRISENALMTVGFFGGAIGMYVTMHLIRHKTKHKKFMIGLPLFIVLHLALILTAVIFL